MTKGSGENRVELSDHRPEGARGRSQPRWTAQAIEHCARRGEVAPQLAPRYRVADAVNERVRIGLVAQLPHCDRIATTGGMLDEHCSLVGLPSATPIARPRSGGERENQRGIAGVREGDDLFPAPRRERQGEVRRVGPSRRRAELVTHLVRRGAANAQVHRRERAEAFPELGPGKIQGRNPRIADDALRRATPRPKLATQHLGGVNRHR